MAELIPCDLHVHPDYSIDASSSIEEYCRRASVTGLKVIGFSTHYDINPKRLDLDAFMVVDGKQVRVDDCGLSRYCRDIEIARQNYPDLRILLGLEIDYFLGIEKETERLRQAFPFDYFIGSVHCLDNIAISDNKEGKQYFASHTLQQMTQEYLKLLYDCVSCGLFDVIGHADYYWRFAIPYFGEIVYEIYKGRLGKIAKAAAQKHVGFEINTSQVRKGKDFHPRMDFLLELVSQGGFVNSIGSDSHRAEHLGADINIALASLAHHNIPFQPLYETIQA
jgi:histidinol-phosphatase (PHP family)